MQCDFQQFMASRSDNTNEWKDLQLSLNHLLSTEAGVCSFCGNEKLSTPTFQEQVERSPGLNFCCQQFYDQLVDCILKLADLEKTQPKTSQKEGNYDDDDEDGDGYHDDYAEDVDDDDDGDKGDVEDDEERIGVRYVVKIMETMNYSHMFDSSKIQKDSQQQKALCCHEEEDYDEDDEDDDDEAAADDGDDDHGNVSWKFHVLEMKILELLRKIKNFLREADEDNYYQEKRIDQCQDIWKEQSSTVFHPSGHVAMVRLSQPGKTQTGCSGGTSDHVIIVDDGNGILCVARNGGSLVVNQGATSKLRLWMNGSECIEFHPDNSIKRILSNDLPFKKFKVQVSPNLTLEVTSLNLVTLNFTLVIPGGGKELNLNVALKLGTDFGATKVSGLESLVPQFRRINFKFWKVLGKMRRSLGLR